MHRQAAANSLKHILTLEKFKMDPEEIAEVYPRAYALPSFFSHNLVSPRRVVKYFQGAQALVGAFYYQLMKLALELQPEEVNYRDLVFDKFVRFELFGQGELEDDIFSDFQYRKFFKDFIELVEKEDVPNFERTVEKYPIIDEILVKYFRIILPMPMLMELQEGKGKPMDVAREILTFLCREFQITLTQIGPCFKLEESDTFLYFENIQEVFLAFNQVTVQSMAEESSEFTSTFECGEGNSFLTKYHTQTVEATPKMKQKTLYLQKDSIMLLDTKENITQSPLSSEPFKQNHLLTPSYGQFSTDRWKDSELSERPLPPSRQDSTLPFQPLLSLLNKSISHPTLTKPPQALYSQFTDSLILKQMPSANRQGIKHIKDKYRRENRASIRNFF